MKLKIDNERCLRCGMCAASFPEVFDFDDEGNIKVTNENINEENIEEIKNFKENACPVGAIEEVKEEKKDTNE
jgi:ferredoxin